MTNTTKFIIDINKHGIRRERPAVGYKAYKKKIKENKDGKDKEDKGHNGHIKD